MATARIISKDNRPVKFFFEDEAAFGRMNHVRKCWVHRPDRAIVKKQTIREYLYAFTTVCPQTGETCSIISPFCNTEAMNALLLETNVAFPNYRIVMIMDSAGWHTTSKLDVPENITILPLPPYSPELNPVEHVWDYIREQKQFNNYTFDSLDEVDKRLGIALCDLNNEKDLIRPMCNFD
ncbi:MAG: IS630 family transposase [Bacteroidetes bacterium]|nr:IS630 family transposase [Bacteroidota bacterium]